LVFDMLFLLSLSFFALLNCIHYTPVPGKERSVKSFDEWMIFFKKSYSTTSEKLRRYKNYLQSVDRVEKLKKMNLSSSVVWGLTKFADMGIPEFREKMLMKPHALPGLGQTSKPSVPEPLSDIAPSANVDWVAKGKTTPIKNQGSCGSCWAFSATESIESANLITGALKNPTSEATWLAPQQIVDCDSAMSGCSGGWPFQAMGWIITQKGQDTESSYPYTGTQGTCAESSATIGADILSYKNVTGNEAALYAALSNPTIGPLSICCDASQWSSYSGGLFPTSECSNQPANIDHAIQLTGYNTGSTLGAPYWIVRNSWGADWGESGFIYLPYGQNPCAITSYVSYATGAKPKN